MGKQSKKKIHSESNNSQYNRSKLKNKNKIRKSGIRQEGGASAVAVAAAASGDVQQEEVNEQLDKIKYQNTTHEVSKFDDKYLQNLQTGLSLLDKDGIASTELILSKKMSLLLTKENFNKLNIPYISKLSTFITTGSVDSFISTNKDKINFLKNNSGSGENTGYPYNITTAIAQEENNKVAIYTYDLYLYNIDNIIDVFITNSVKFKTGTDTKTQKDDEFLNRQFKTFITNIIGTFKSASNPKGTVYKGLYDLFDVQNFDAVPATKIPSSQYMKMYIPKFTNDVSGNQAKEGAVLSFVGEEDEETFVGGGAKDLKIKSLDQIAKENVSKFRTTFTDGWENFSKTSNPNGIMYGYNQVEAFKDINQEYSLKDPKVKIYIDKCNDLQVFYINKHIELYDLFNSMFGLVKANVDFNNIIEKLLDPDIIDKSESSGDLVKIKGLNKLNMKELSGIQKSIRDTNQQFSESPAIPMVGGATINPLTVTGAKLNARNKTTKQPRTRFLRTNPKSSSKVSPEIIPEALLTLEVDNNQKFIIGIINNLNNTNITYLKTIGKTKISTVYDFIKFLNENKTNSGIIQFNDIDNFRDYMFKDNNNKIEFRYTRNDPNDPKIITFDIVSIDYENNSLTLQKNNNSNDINTLNTMNLKPDITIKIPTFKKYFVKHTNQDNQFNKLATGSEQIVYTEFIKSVSGAYNNELMMTFDRLDNTPAITTPTTPPKAAFFKNILYKESATTATDKLLNSKFGIITNLLKTFNTEYNKPNNLNKPVFDFVDYFVDSIQAYSTLQAIKRIQSTNMKSLETILGTVTSEVVNADGTTIPATTSLETKVKLYKTNYQAGIMNPTKFPMKAKNTVEHWKNFATDNDKDGNYFNTSAFVSNTTTEASVVQNAIYKCYDLQILYLVKHLELVEMFKIVFYFFDMLVKKMCILMFILSLYKKEKYGQGEYGSVQIANAFVNIQKLLESSQRDVVGVPSVAPVQAGGSSSEIPTTESIKAELEEVKKLRAAAENDKDLVDLDKAEIKTYLDAKVKSLGLDYELRTNSDKKDTMKNATGHSSLSTIGEFSKMDKQLGDKFASDYLDIIEEEYQKTVDIKRETLKNKEKKNDIVNLEKEVDNDLNTYNREYKNIRKFKNSNTSENANKYRTTEKTLLGNIISKQNEIFTKSGISDIAGNFSSGQLAGYITGDELSKQRQIKEINRIAQTVFKGKMFPTTADLSPDQKTEKSALITKFIKMLEKTQSIDK